MKRYIKATANGRRTTYAQASVDSSVTDFVYDYFRKYSFAGQVVGQTPKSVIVLYGQEYPQFLAINKLELSNLLSTAEDLEDAFDEEIYDISNKISKSKAIRMINQAGGKVPDWMYEDDGYDTDAEGYFH